MSNPMLNDTYDHIVYEKGNPVALIGKNMFERNAPVQLGTKLVVQTRSYRVIDVQETPLEIQDPVQKSRSIDIIVTVERIA